MTPSEKTQLKDYSAICDTLKSHRFFNETEELKYKLDKGGKGLHSLNGYDEDLLKSFLMDFRKIVMEGEPTQFYQIANIVSRRERKLVPKIKKIKDRYTKRLKASPIVLETTEGKKQDIVEIWLYGKYFHEKDDRNKELIKDLTALKKQLFITVVFDLSSLAIELDQLISKEVFNKSVAKDKVSAPTKQEISDAYNAFRGEELKKVAEKITSQVNIEKATFTHYEQVRLFLFAAGIFYEKSLPSEVLGNHEMHCAYTYRDKILLFFAESWLVFKTIVSDEWDQKVGWYWFPNLSKKTVVDFSIKYLSNSENSKVRLGALGYLDKFWSKDFYGKIHELATDESKEVREKVIEMLREHQSKDVLKTVEVLLKDKDKDLQKKAFELKIDMLVRYDYREAFSIIKKTQDIDDYYFSNLELLLKKLNRQEFEDLLTLDHQITKILVYKELIRRRSLNAEKLQELFADSLWEVRFFALNELVSRGSTYSREFVEKVLKSDDKNNPSFRYSYKLYKLKKEDILRKLYESSDEKELETKLDWTATDGSLIYEILCKKHPKKYLKDVRNDVRTNFKNKKDIWKKRSADRFKISVEKLDETFGQYEDMITRQFITAGLNVLLEHGSKSDVSIAKSLIDLDRYETKRICISIIKKYGGQKDSLFLLDIGKDEQFYDDDALVGALLLDNKNRYGVIRRTLELDKARYLKITLAFCAKYKQPVDLKTVTKLLENESDSVRVCAIAYLSLKLKRKDLEKVLKDYHKKSYYYYNVVCWIDRILYASPVIRKSFHEDLKKCLEKELPESIVDSERRFYPRRPRKLGN